MVVDLSFPIIGPATLPADHAWPLFGAVAGVVPGVHGSGESSSGFGLHQITGQQLPGRLLTLTATSRLTVRTPVDRIAELLPLAGQPLDVAGSTLRCGPPEVRPLMPAASLRSRTVTIKLRDEPTSPAAFTAAVQRQLDRLDVSAEIDLPERTAWSGESRTAQRTVAIKGIEVVGYEVRLHRLSEAGSLTVQEHGIGGRRAMGCGLFVPFESVRPDAADPEGPTAKGDAK